MKLQNGLKKIAVSVLSAAMALSCFTLPAAKVDAAVTLKDSATVNEALKIRFDEPTSEGELPGSSGSYGASQPVNNRWQQLTLPIGNSYMGANVYGDVATEHLTFNHKTLWTGGPSESRPNYDGGNLETINYGGVSYTPVKFIEKIQQEFFAGNTSVASDMCGYLVGEGAAGGYGAYQAWGDIYVAFEGLTNAHTNYERNLDLSTSVANVDFEQNGVTYHREFIANYPDNVIAMKFTASQATNASITFPVKQGEANGGTKYNKNASYAVSGNRLTVSGSMVDNQMKFNGQLEVVAKNGTVSGSNDTLKVNGSTEFYVFVTASTDYENVYPNYRSGESDAQVNARVDAVLDAAVAKGYDTIKANAIADYQEIFNRVELNLGQGVTEKMTNDLLIAYNNGSATLEERRQLETTLFQFGRFLQIQSSRAGDLPANLQGVWSIYAGSENYVPWASDYHMNVNLQMNYWPTYVTNMAECSVPLVDYIDSLREPGRVTAERYHGVVSGEGEANGFTAHTQNTPFGWTCPGWAFNWGWSPAAVPWMLQNVYENYEYTLDKDYLRSTIYPILKEQAAFYEAILVTDPESGRLVTVPAYSSEHGPRTAGNTYENALVWQLFKDCIEAAQALGVDEAKQAEWAEKMEQLDPIEIGAEGQIKEWYHETTWGSAGGDLTHRHMSHLLGLFPGDLISVDNNEYMDAAIISLLKRGDDATGWGMGQRLNSWARTGDGNHAYQIIKAFFKRGAYPNLWDAHAPFQIDGNFGYTAGVAEMLLQTNMGYLNLLPALTDDWTDGKVSGFIGRGNFEIDMEWHALSLTDVDITSKAGGDCTVQYTNISEATVLDSKGNEVATTTINKDRVSFATTEGETYTFVNIPEKPAAAPTGTKAYTDGKAETWVLFDESAVASAYKLYASTDGTNYEAVAENETAEKFVVDYNANATYRVSAIVNGAESDWSKEIKPVVVMPKDKIDDRDSMITYSSGWGDWGPESEQYMTTEKFSSNNPGDVAELIFVGNGVKVIGMTSAYNGGYDLYIDGELVAENVNNNTPTTVRQVTLSDIGGLDAGLHHLKLVTKTLNGYAKVSLDAFEFTHSGAATGINVTAESDTINIATGNTLQMSATYTPTGTTGGAIVWSVSNGATIDENGLLTVPGEGDYVVTATDSTNPTVTGSKTITVVRTTLINMSANTDVHVESCDSQYTGETADKTLDYNNGTIWHSDWSGDDALPISVTYDLAKTYDLEKIQFLGRQNGSVNGDIFEFDLYVGDDVNNLALVDHFVMDTTGSGTSEELANKTQFQTVEFQATGRYVKMTVTRSGSDNAAKENRFVSMAEIRFYGVEQSAVEQANKEELKAVIDEVKALNGEDYSIKSWANATVALEAAEAVYAKEDATQEEVDAAKAELQTKKDNLVERAPLKPVLAEAEAKLAETDKYTEDSYNKLKEAYDGAKFLYDNTFVNYVQSDVYTHKGKVEEALAGLVEKPQLVAPEMVTDLEAEDTDYKTITLTWAASEGATEYDVYRKSYKEDAVFELVDTVSETTYESVGVMTGKTYSFYVVAKNAAGEAQASETVEAATTLQGEVNLAIEQVSTAKFKLSWNKIDGATRYIVYRKRNNDKMLKVLTLGPNDTEYVTAEMPNGDYTFQVRAGRYDSKDRVMTAASNKVNGSVEALKPVVSVKAGTKSAKVSWKKMEGVTHYIVYRATSSKYTKLITTKELSYTAKSLTSGKKYYFKVRGYKTYKSGTDLQYTVYTPYSSAKAVTAK